MGFVTWAVGYIINNLADALRGAGGAANKAKKVVEEIAKGKGFVVDLCKPEVQEEVGMSPAVVFHRLTSTPCNFSSP